jgi:lipopolysaccharide biosynthesis glycosyltransferase
VLTSAGEPRPAQEIVVVYSIDPGFLLPCAVSVRSLVENFSAGHEPGYSLRILVYHDNTISADQFAGLREAALSGTRSVAIELRAFNFTLPAIRCEAPHWNNIETVAILILPALLEGESRALFLDADTMVVGSIVDLWNTELRGSPCACTLDFDGRSPNTGVMLYDIVEWNRRNLTGVLLDYVTHHRTFHVDQEPFAAVPDARFERLSRKWNYHGIDNWMYERFGGNLPVRDVRIVHFNGSPRPWFRDSPRAFAAEWLRYLRQTPFGNVALPKLAHRHFFSFRAPRLETRLRVAAASRRSLLVPYLVLRNLRMAYFYLRYLGSTRLSAVRVFGD